MLAASEKEAILLNGIFQGMLADQQIRHAPDGRSPLFGRNGSFRVVALYGMRARDVGQRLIDRVPVIRAIPASPGSARRRGKPRPFQRGNHGANLRKVRWLDPVIGCAKPHCFPLVLVRTRGTVNDHR